MKMLVAAHDAGGAEVVSSWLRLAALSLDPEAQIHYFLGGPAEEIFARKLGAESRERIPAWDYDRVICGTSGEANLERVVVNEARARNIPVIVWLDHWKNYPQRVERLPNEFWAPDAYAYALARKTWPGTEVYLCSNPYLEETVAEICALDAERGPRQSEHPHVLYVKDAEQFGWKTIVESIHEHVDDPKSRIRIRLHPSKAKAPRPLAQDVSWADTVIGFDSMALVVALEAKRRVVSLLEKGSIPYEGIERPALRGRG